MTAEDACVVLSSEQTMRAAATAARPRMVAATRGAGDQRSARRASHSRATPHTRNTWGKGKQKTELVNSVFADVSEILRDLLIYIHKLTPLYHGIYY